jgi:microsomal dipeptidase-like Zn-dependent dipeptidase
MNNTRRPNSIVPTYGGPVIMDIRFRRGFLSERAVLANRHLPQWQTGRLGGSVIHIHSLTDATLVLKDIEEAAGTLRLAASPDDLLAANQAGQTAVMLCASFDDVGLNPDLLAIYARLGITSFALSLNSRNMLVDGCAERTQAGLSTVGINVVKDLFRRGILIDVSHVSDQGFWDVLEAVDGGVFASHSNARSLCDNPRNLSDEMLQAIAAKGGIVGISSYPTLLTKDPKPTLEHALDHVQYMIDLIGPEHVAVGGDFIDFALDFVMPKIKSTDFKGTLYGEDHFDVMGLNCAADLPNLAEGLARRGLNDEQIDRVMARNFVNFWRTSRERQGAGLATA